MKDFRPISLVHSFAKLVTKILANRLAPRLDSLVSTNQSAFVRGRCIHDNFLLVQQMARFLHNRREPRRLLKLDITKAFDSVSWPFLLEVLAHLGFGRRWREIICYLLRSSSTRVLLNGQPGQWIAHRRGLRQEGPLSPMLFILVMDVLNALIGKADEEALLQPLATHRVKHRVSLYADDVALFIRPTPEDLSTIKEILRLFGEVSGLRTNMQNSSIVPIRCTTEQLEVVSRVMPCEVIDFPCKYLGLPLSIRKLTKTDLQPIVDQIADMLPDWKAALMSTAGRAVLVKAVLTAIPVYLLIALDVPKWLLRAIDKLHRAFLWKGRRLVNGGHCPVTWERACRPEELGGLGIHNLEILG